MELESWTNSFEIDVAVINSEILSDPRTHIETFGKIRRENPEYWEVVSTEILDTCGDAQETNLRLHNIFVATLVQKRREQIANLHKLVEYTPSTDVIELLAEMNDLDGIEHNTKYKAQNDTVTQ